jgi:glycosyltransferase involved in cell wall biosynthesis
MRVLHIVEASFAGVGRHVLDLASAQAEAGRDVHVVFSPIRESASFAAERAELHSITWHPVDMSRTIGAVDVPAFRAVRRIIGSVGPDVVHGHSTKGGLMARLVPNGGRPVVYTPNAVYSMNPTLDKRARSLVKQVERALASRTSTIIAVSPEERVHLTDEIGVDPDLITLIPNGIQPFEPENSTSVRAALDLPEDGPIVGFVGRLDGQKAPDDLLEIYARVAAEVPDAHFVVVGDGPLRAELETRWTKTESELAGRVQFLGEQPGTWAMSAMDLMVLPSRYEGFPYVLIEAAHLGLPIVTTAEACASLLVDGPASIAVGQAGDIEGLAAKAVESLVTSRADAAAGTTLGAGRDRRFTVAGMNEAVDDVYRLALGTASLA